VAIEIHGHVDEGWGRVADAFRAGFDGGGEVGAAWSVYDGDRAVVDIWAGIADPRTGRAWERDTVAIVFSTTKGAAALCLMRLAERGLVDLDAPVVDYWPEYGAHGKEGTLVRAFLDHEAGVPDVDTRLTLDEACAWDPVIRALESQRPLWNPGTRYLYHGLMSGFLIGEIVRRVTGRTIGRYFADEIAGPLGLSSWIGLPASLEPRVAPMIETDPVDPVETIDAAYASFLDSLSPEEQSTVSPQTLGEYRRLLEEPVATHTIGGSFPKLVGEDELHNTPQVHAAEFPATNLISDARSLARMYAAAIGEVDGVRLLRPETVDAIMAHRPSSTPFGLPDELARIPRLTRSPFARGFWRLSETTTPAVGPRSFGHPGAGGSLGGADPDSGLAYGYVMNRMRGDFARAIALLESATGTGPATS
jgi:CubicO group peptidase (beta-lactamase class C family)